MKLLTLTTLLTLFSTNLASSEDRRLLKLSLEAEPKWYSESEVSQLIEDSKHFVDVTDDPKPESRLSLPEIKSDFVVPDDIRYWDQVRSVIPLVDPIEAKAQLTHLSSYHNRYFNTTTGVESAEWIYSQAKESCNKIKGCTINKFIHDWPQPSIIVNVEGYDSNLKSQLVVIGAHLDSINRTQRATGRAPGADDDGTGTVTLLQVLKALSKVQFKPKRSLEFQWYAAEEIGLRGSRDIAIQYRSKGVDVVTQAQFDMSGYLSEKKQIRIISDFTNPELSYLMKRFVEAYTQLYWVDGKCGYGCSDHASWFSQGYRSAFPFEDTPFNKIHTENDKVEFVNWEHWYQFSKVAVAYVVELSEPHN